MSCTPVTVTAPDGAALTACTHGGHVLGWVPVGGAQRLWLSPTAECGPGRAIRGGVPVIFPQFAGRGPLPKHGFARDRAWQRVDGCPAGTWAATLRDDEQTRALWPYAFELRLTATVAAQELTIDLEVRNDGAQPFEFTAALHGYLVVRDPHAELAGLGGLHAQDNARPEPADDGDPVWLGAPGESVPALQPRDVSLLGATDPVDLVDGTLGRLTLTAEAFTDRVVWNPGPGHGLADVPAGAEAGFVCVEAARLTPVTLPAGATWTGRQTLRAEPSVAL
ncbi:D-hexose-6-phosphate mutarotase [Spongisporangium articulatum]|uniref:Putative glucose-6-phosphate 1-epimerase n=1 Tax=Spongisporangium articulatum TaxID=3362603 RepID=A0ABW8AHW4_9ACTN